MVPISAINLIIAFGAGILTFFAGCLVPIVPAYVSFLTGVWAGDTQRKAKTFKTKTLYTSLLFVLGFISVFLVLGAAFNSLARFVGVYRTTVQVFGGGIMVILGLHTAGIMKIPLLYRTIQIDIHDKLTKNVSLSAFLLGLVFGFAWTPCIGPVLASILFWSSQTATLKEGLLLLLLFGVGLGVPFIGLGLFIDTVFEKVKKIEQFSPVIQKVTGGFLVLTGILFVTGQFGLFSQYLMARLGNWSYILEFKQ